MYGAAGDGAFNMVQGVIEALSTVANGHGLEAAIASIPLSNFSIAAPRATWASNENDLLRQIVLMNCSLSVIADEPISTGDDLPTPEKEVNQQWTTKVKEAIQVLRPDLSMYFNREAILVDGGVPVKFAVLTERLAAQFGILEAIAAKSGDGRCASENVETGFGEGAESVIDCCLSVWHTQTMTI